MSKQPFLISHVITSSKSMQIIFTNLETKEIFTSSFFQSSLIPWFINVFQLVKDYGESSFYLYNHFNESTNICIYKDYITFSPEFEILVKTLLWERLFKGTVRQTNSPANTEIPDLLEGL